MIILSLIMLLFQEQASTRKQKTQNLNIKREVFFILHRFYLDIFILMMSVFVCWTSKKEKENPSHFSQEREKNY